MNSYNEKLDLIKKQFISYIGYCFNKNKSYNYEYLVDAFLFDNITILSNIDLKKSDIENFTEYSNENPELEQFIIESLSFLMLSLKGTRKDKPSKYRISPKQETTVGNIFMGLSYSGNNDSGYKKIPSALSLATFNV